MNERSDFVPGGRDVSDVQGISELASLKFSAAESSSYIRFALTSETLASLE